MTTHQTSLSPEMANHTATHTSPTTRQKPRLIFVNLMRIYAMTLVVIIHVASIPAPHFNTITPYEWWVANAFHVLSKGGPPLFTMISGMLLLSNTQPQPLSDFFRKRFARVLGPFIIWAGIYLLWRIYYKEELLTPTQIRDLFLIGPMYYHLWFIQMILGLYIATPILRVYIKNASRRDLTYFVLIWVITVSILPFIDRFLDIRIGIQVFITTGYVGYFVLGYYLKDVWLNTKQIIIALGIVVFGLLFTEWSTFALLDANAGQFDAYFLDYYSFNMILVVTGLFLILKSIPYDKLLENRPRLRQRIIFISSCSFGIYFVHVMMMELLADGVFGFQLSALSINPLLAIPLASAVTMLLSFLITAVLKQIPFIRYIVP
jgi:surface polysaccharide O-acyltransferase-like enzyme